MSKMRDKGRHNLRQEGVGRRTLLISAIAIAAGFAVPQGALGSGMTLEDAKRIIGDRYKTFELGNADRLLTGPEISELVKGNTLYGVLYDDEPYVLAFRRSGAAYVKIADRPLDLGRWWVDMDANTITSQWQSAAGGELLVLEYYATDQAGVFKTIAKPKNRWSMFLVEEGIAPGMGL